MIHTFIALGSHCGVRRGQVEVRSVLLCKQKAKTHDKDQSYSEGADYIIIRIVARTPAHRRTATYIHSASQLCTTSIHR